MIGARRHRRFAIWAGALASIALAILVLQSLVTGVEVVDVDLSLSALRASAQDITGQHLPHLLGAYGYWTVFILVLVESMGIPVPGETILLIAAIYAGTTHHLSLHFVVAAAAAGAILGDNVGYLIGREGGYRLLRRYGARVGLSERRLKLLQYLFWRYGGAVVFLGRFVSVLRMWAAFFAGATHLPWRRFLLYNAAGGIVWATIYGLGGYLLGDAIHRVGSVLGVISVGVAVLGLAAGAILLRRHERAWEDVAERELPGPFGAAPPTSRGNRTTDGTRRPIVRPDLMGDG